MSNPENKKHLHAALDGIADILKEYGLVGIVSLADGEGHGATLTHLEAPFSLIHNTEEGYLFKASAQTHSMEEFVNNADSTMSALNVVCAMLQGSNKELNHVKEEFSESMDKALNTLQFKINCINHIVNEN